MNAAPSATRLERWMSGPDGRLDRRRLAGAVACGYAIFSVTYLPINVLSVGRSAHALLLPGEARLPFLPLFEYFYVLTYFVGLLTVATIRHYSRFRSLLRASILAMTAAYVTYVIYPVRVERPAVEVTSLATWLLSIEYLEPPYNAFPSLHVAFSWLAVLSAEVTRRTRRLLSVLAIGVSVSTVFVRQHYAVDAVAGFLLAWIAWRVSAPGSGVRPPPSAATAASTESR